MDIETLVNEILTEMKCPKDEWRKMSLRLHEPVLSTQQNEALLSRKHANEGGNMRGTNMFSRSSGEGVQR